jgi:hypothetical protein
VSPGRFLSFFSSIFTKPFLGPLKSQRTITPGLPCPRVTPTQAH